MKFLDTRARDEQYISSCTSKPCPLVGFRSTTPMRWRICRKTRPLLRPSNAKVWMELWSEKGFLMGGQDWFICHPILSSFHLGILSIASDCKQGESNYPAWYSQSTVSLLANLHSANRNRVWETSLNSSKQLQIQYSYPPFVQIIKWSITLIKIWDRKATRLMIA